MKRLVIVIAANICITMTALCQQSILFSQYMLNTETCNPAAVGYNDMINVKGIFRSQYAGFEGAPLVYNVGADMGFSIGKTKHGAGLNFYDQSMGLFRFQDVNLDYAYRFPIQDGFLSAGLSINFTTVSYDTKRLHQAESDYHSEDDPAIAQTNGNDFKMDLGFGVLYKSPVWWAGVSLMNILAPEYNLGGENSTKMYHKTRNIFFVGGYNISFTNSLIKLKLAAAINSDFVSWSGSINANVDYKDRYWGGIGYRIDGAVTFMAGARIIDGLVIAYSFDLPTSGLIQSAGSHEVTLSYSFSLDFNKKNKYKSIRYL